ncbi:MAG: MerR family transcriptional regulator [Lachnospiraceae bacterium]|nr:MerR family transcriptional regulator [Lachnospiraceae bacterium]
MFSEEELQEKRREYSLSVGQFAKLCVTTRDTLRHYYELNILLPWVDPTNGYHYYSASQISSFFFITTMRQAGCSLAEIGNIIHSLSKESIVKLVNARILDLQRELFNINKQIAALHLGMWILGQFENRKPGVPFLSAIPPLSVTKTPIQNRNDSFHTADIAEDISAHLARAAEDETLVTFPSGVTIAYEDLCRGHYAYNNVISLSLLPADGVSKFPLQGQRAVLCYHDHYASDINRTYARIAAYIKKNRLKACSDLFSVSLINLYDNEKTNHAYYKYLFVCVE